MASVNPSGGSHPDCDQVIGSDGSRESDRRDEDDHASRPSSRLGFNRASLSATPSDAPSSSEAVQWSRSLFQNVGINDLRLESIKASKPDMAVSSNSALPITISQGEGTVPHPSTEQKDADIASANVEGECVKSPAVPRKSPTSVSRLCFPFVTTSPPRRKKPQPPPSPPPPPPPRHKYSCPPSLMSPFRYNQRSPTQPRHHYRQHGHSRLSFQHTKWFWAMREDQLGGGSNGAYDPNNGAYGGISSDAPVMPTVHPAVLSRPPSPITSSQSTMPPITIHPRRGDISALRDPYSTHIDRCFVGLPTWTISKTIWMHDLHLAMEQRQAANQQHVDEEPSDYESESELETSMSTSFSDDSDTTLVESESETDLSSYFSSASGVNSKGQVISSHDTEDDFVVSSSVPSSRSISPTITEPTRKWTRSSKGKQIVSRDLVNSKPSWATNWYHRWDVLVDLSRRKTDRKHAHLEMTPLRPPLSPSDQEAVARHLTELESFDDDTWDARLESV
ncbi:unnamed protein product [Cyclocybe aegerita]|uniref:Uncharacterized protein n=1 Tax=Cyclocybe aegerita TaxID=1973307 RepID=A0A8S0WJQ7_CYCAE|nr:unnamed protein product [Cyclocybe aegerita]